MLLIQFIILQIFIFGVVIFALKKILYSDTQGAIKRLEGTYQDLLKKQKDLTQKIEMAEKEYAEKKEEAIKIVDRMKSDAMEEIRGKKDEILKQAKQQADEIIGKARASADEFYKKIELEVTRKMIDTAADLVAASFNPKVLSALHGALVRDFFENCKGLDLSNVGSHVEKLIVRTAFPLAPEIKNQINVLVTTKLKRSLEIEEVVDKGIVAGMVLQFGSLILDTSLPSFVRETAEKTKAELEYKQ